MLIHQLSSGFWGKHNEFKDEMKNQKKLMKVIKKIYQEHTNLSEEALNYLVEQKWSKNLDHLVQKVTNAVTNTEDRVITPELLES